MPRAGQTKPPVAPRLSDRIAIGVLTTTFPPELVDRVIAKTGRAEQRQRLLPARVVVYDTLAMCLFAQVGYEEVMRLLVEGWPGCAASRGPGRCRTKARSPVPGPGLARRRCGSCSSRSPARWRPRRPRARGIATGDWWRWMAPPWTWRTRRQRGGVRSAWWGPGPGGVPPGAAGRADRVGHAGDRGRGHGRAASWGELAEIG